MAHRAIPEPAHRLCWLATGQPLIEALESRFLLSAVGLGSSTKGSIAKAFEADSFELSVKVGERYQFLTTLGTLEDSVITLYDGEDYIASNDDDYNGEGLASCVIWTATFTGTVTIEVTGYEDAKGTYWLLANEYAGSELDTLVLEQLDEEEDESDGSEWEDEGEGDWGDDGEIVDDEEDDWDEGSDGSEDPSDEWSGDDEEWVDEEESDEAWDEETDGEWIDDGDSHYDLPYYGGCGWGGGSEFVDVMTWAELPPISRELDLIDTLDVESNTLDSLPAETLDDSLVFDVEPEPVSLVFRVCTTSYAYSLATYAGGSEGSHAWQGGLRA